MKARPSMEKRRKEMARQDKQQAKIERRERRKVERAERDESTPGEDPDLAGIVAGPQPTPEWMLEPSESEEAEDVEAEEK